MDQRELQRLARQFSAGQITRQQYIRRYTQLTKTPLVLTNNSKDADSKPAYEQQRHRYPFLQTIGSVFNFIKNYHKQIIALLGTVGIFLSVYFNNFHHSTGSPQTRIVVLKKAGDTDNIDRLRTQDIKLITELLTHNDHWNQSLTNDFITQWSKLSPNEKLVIKQSQWYRQFALRLSTKINQLHNDVDKNSIAFIQKRQVLVTLADALVFNNDTVTTTNPPVMNTASLSNTGNNATKPTAPSETNPSAGLTLSHRTSTANKTTVTNITSEEIADILNQFSNNVEAGNLDALLSLFSGNGTTETSQSTVNLKKEYEADFSQTIARNVAIGSVSWQHGNNMASGHGYYKASFRMRGTQDKKTVSAALNITFVKKNNRIYISLFELMDREETLSRNTDHEHKIVNQLSQQHQRDYPSRSELQDLVTRYVDAYEAGDIDTLMTLFASSSWTTDKAGLTELRQEYSDLFDSTTEREIFVYNIDWSMTGGKAVGTGELAMTHHPINDGNVTSSLGKIRFMTKKDHSGVYITHLFHIINE